MRQRYVIEDQPSHNDVRALEERLYRYNVQRPQRLDLGKLAQGREPLGA